MDKNFYQQQRAREHQREISQELKTRNLLKNAAPRPPMTAKQVRHLVLRIAPAVIIMTILLLLSLLG